MIETLLKQAKQACQSLQLVDHDTKVASLQQMADALIQHTEDILQANELDCQASGYTEAKSDRLRLTKDRIEQMADGMRQVAQLDDPIGTILDERIRPNGLRIVKKRTPIGVVATIYESRPNVTADLAALCLMTNNVCVLKGGKEAFHSNQAIVKVLKEASLVDFLYFIDVTDRAVVDELLNARGLIDLVIPRGGAGLIRHVVDHAKVPVIETGAGICHLYVDQEANLDMALSIAENGKMSRPSVCNALETILVHQAVAPTFLPALAKRFVGVELLGDDRVRQIIDCGQADYAKEYDDLLVNLKIVDSLEQAIEHIYQYSTQHSETIVTDNNQTAKVFMESLDSAVVYHNASTRFSDGGEFGFGAEVGISTQKLHARGPMALPELCSYRYFVYGSGQIR